MSEHLFAYWTSVTLAALCISYSVSSDSKIGRAVACFAAVIIAYVAGGLFLGAKP